MNVVSRALILLPILLVPSAAASLEIRPGLEAGGSGVTVEYDRELDGWEKGYRLDFHMAATVQFEFGPQGSVLAGLRYSGLGAEVDVYGFRTATDPVGSDALSGTFQLEQRYLGIPIGLRWDLTRRGGPYLFGGLETAFLLAANVDYRQRAFEGAPFQEGDRDITDQLNRINAVVFVGAGLALTVGSHEIEISVRYGHGLTDVGEESEWVTNWKTREVALGLGWRI